MVDIPKFQIYGSEDPAIEQAIQPQLGLRSWNELGYEEKQTCFFYLRQRTIFNNNDKDILPTIIHLNHFFLRECPGKLVSKLRHGDDQYKREEAAYHDLEEIFLRHENDAMVMRMLSVLASFKIRKHSLELAEEAEEEEKKLEYIEYAFEDFDNFSRVLNHVFAQFSVNMNLTRSGFIPQQDEKISDDIYRPVLDALSAKKWEKVNENLSQMFADYRDQNYAEVIAKAHNSVQRFLQILLGVESKNSKGEFGRLFSLARKRGLIPKDQFSSQIILVIQGFLSSERAGKSSAKPTLDQATSRDALLVMNVTMIFLQHCLQAES